MDQVVRDLHVRERLLEPRPGDRIAGEDLERWRGLGARLAPRALERAAHALALARERAHLVTLLAQAHGEQRAGKAARSCHEHSHPPR